MNLLLSAFRDGGPAMYAVFALGLGSGGVVLALAVLATLDKRVPVAAWMVMPALILGVGGLGTLSGLSMASQAIEAAGTEQRAAMAAAGLAMSLYSDAFARLVVWLLCGASAGLLAIASLVAGRGEGTWDWVGSGVTVAAAWVGGLVYGALMVGDHEAALLTPMLMVLFGGLLVGVAGLRRPADPQALVRSRGRHIATAGLVVFGTIASAGLVEVSSTVTGFKAIAVVDPSEKARFLEIVLKLSGRASAMGWIAVGAVSVGLGVAVARVRHGTDTFARVSAVVTVLMLLAVAAVVIAGDAAAEGVWTVVGEVVGG